MAPIKFLLALSSLALLSCAPAANALSIDNHHINRHVAHDSIARMKRDGQSSRCKPRPAPSSSSPSPSPSPSPPATSDPLPPAVNLPVSTSSTSQPVPSVTPPPTSNSGSGGGKLGIAWALGNDARLKLLKNGRSNFLYTWSPEYPSDATSLGFTPVPQLWGWNQVDDFKSKVTAGYANYVLGMNEPNQSGQSDMSPQDGANLWMQYIQPLKDQGYQLGSPATTSNPNGMDWMNQFMAACYGCTFDFIAIHWYDTTFDKFKTYVELWYNTFKKPIWVTEFACQNFNGGAQPSSDEIWAFYTQAIAWMDQTDYVHMYAPFGFMDDMSNVNPADTLFSGNSLSSLGWLVLNGPSN